jgi:hypothetical protein
VPWLWRLAAGLPPWRPGFDPGLVHVGFVVDKVSLGQGFPPCSSVFPCQFHSTGAPLLGKGQKIIIIFTVIIGLHNKPHGCSASVAYAGSPSPLKKKNLVGTFCFICYGNCNPFCLHLVCLNSASAVCIVSMNTKLH